MTQAELALTKIGEIHKKVDDLAKTHEESLKSLDEAIKKLPEFSKVKELESLHIQAKAELNIAWKTSFGVADGENMSLPSLASFILSVVKLSQA